MCVWYTYHVRSRRCRWGGAFDSAHRSILSLALDLIITHVHAFYISSLAAFAVRALNRRIASPFSLRPSLGLCRGRIGRQKPGALRSVASTVWNLSESTAMRWAPSIQTMWMIEAASKLPCGAGTTSPSDPLLLRAICRSDQSRRATIRCSGLFP